LILEEVWTGKSPTIAYWAPFIVREDTRLKPFEVSESRFIFIPPVDAEVTIQIQLLLRRNFKDVMDWKQWDAADLVIEEETIILSSGM
jgi:hypothetical protein